MSINDRRRNVGFVKEADGGKAFELFVESGERAATLSYTDVRHFNSPRQLGRDCGESGRRRS